MAASVSAWVISSELKTLNLYIARKLVGATLAAIGVLTFVLLSGNLIKVFDLLARGVSAAALGRFILYLLPVALNYTLPFSLLISSVLVFSRLSADNEITAMRASGVSLWQIISPALLLGVVLSGLAFWLQMEVGPRCRFQMDMLLETEGTRNPLVLLEPGRFIELPGNVIYVGRREGDRLYDLHVYCLSSSGKVVRDITAHEGKVTLKEEEETIVLELQDVVVVAADPNAPGDATRLQRVAGQTLTFPLEYGRQLNRKPIANKFRQMDAAAMLGLIHAYAERGIDTTPLYLDLHRRFSLALSPFAFLLLGIPIAIRARRAEPAIGLVMAMAMAAVFYAFLMLAEQFRSAGHHPEWLVWLPNIAYQAGGLYALARLARQ